MSETQDVNVNTGYGYSDDSPAKNPFNFGLNRDARMVDFKWIGNAGKEGAEQEALEIVFEINGEKKNLRKFPVTKAFLKGNKGETTDPKAPEFKQALQDFNATITHIMHAFVDKETYKAKTQVPRNSFQEFCNLIQSLLPANYSEVPLDIFLHYQWNIPTGKDRTYLEIPNTMRDGFWLKPMVPGKFKEQRVEDPSDSEREALVYINENGEKHPFIRNGYFMNRNRAKQQKDENAEQTQEASNAMNSGANVTNTTSSTEPKKSVGW